MARSALTGTFTCEVVPYAAVAPFARLAAREHVSVKPDNGTTWWAVTHPHLEDAGVLAFAGLWRGPSLERFKGAWTRPDFRGMLLGSMLVQTILEAADPTKTLEVIHVAGGSPDFWPGHGLAFTGTTRKNGGRVYRRPPTTP